jgi:predicted nicotinamide N-methyase
MIKSYEDDANVSLSGSLTNTSVSCNSSDDRDDEQENSEQYRERSAGDGGEEDMDSLCEELGLLFEGSQATTWRHFSWEKKNTAVSPAEGQPTSRPTIHAAVSCIDDDPGAVQSGHYLWPAAISLSEYMIAKSGDSENVKGKVRSILELGAGTGLPSLCAIQLFQDTLEYLVVTDRDLSTLERARDSYETTMMELYEDAETEEGQESVVNEISSILVEFLPLTWGKEKQQWKELQKRLHLDHSILKANSQVCFDLVLGSDLIHSFDVVEPLLQTAKMAMTKSDGDIPAGRFLLSQSFAFDADTEKEIGRVCNALQLSRRTVEDNLSIDGSKIQEFRHTYPYEEKKIEP